MLLNVRMLLCVFTLFALKQKNVLSLECGKPNASYHWDSSQPPVKSLSDICVLIRSPSSSSLEYHQMNSTSCKRAKEEFCISNIYYAFYVFCCDTKNCFNDFTDVKMMDKCLKCDTKYGDTSLITVNGICLLSKKAGQTITSRHAVSTSSARDCGVKSLQHLCDNKGSKEKYERIYCCNSGGCLDGASEKDLLTCSYILNITATDYFCKKTHDVKPEWMITKDAGVCLQSNMMNSKGIESVNKILKDCSMESIAQVCTQKTVAVYCCRTHGCLEVKSIEKKYQDCPIHCSADVTSGPVLTPYKDVCVIANNGSSTPKYVKLPGNCDDYPTFRSFCLSNPDVKSYKCCQEKKCVSGILDPGDMSCDTLLTTTTPRKDPINCHRDYYPQTEIMEGSMICIALSLVNDTSLIQYETRRTTKCSDEVKKSFCDTGLYSSYFCCSTKFCLSTAIRDTRLLPCKTGLAISYSPVLVGFLLSFYFFAYVTFY